MAYKAAAVREMADGSRPVDEAVFAKSASDLSAAAGMIVDGFPSGSGVGEVSISNGLPDIWDNWDDFQAKASALQSAASEVATLAGRGGFAAAYFAALALFEAFDLMAPVGYEAASGQDSPDAGG